MSDNSAAKEQWQRKWEEIYRREKAAHDLIVSLCAAKNIRLTLYQEGKSGHCEIPEIWTIERAMPLDAEDLDAIAANGALHFERETGDDGTLYATKFTRGGGWTVYEQEKQP